MDSIIPSGPLCPFWDCCAIHTLKNTGQAKSAIKIRIGSFILARGFGGEKQDLKFTGINAADNLLIEIV
jgi:hypothetical protein